MAKKECNCENCDCEKDEHPMDKWDKKVITDKDIANMTMGIRNTLALELIQGHFSILAECEKCKTKNPAPLPVFTIDGDAVFTYFKCPECNHITKMGDSRFIRYFEHRGKNLKKLVSGMYNITIRQGTLDNEKEVVGQIVSPVNERKYIWNLFAQIGIYPPIPYTIDIVEIDAEAEKSV